MSTRATPWIMGAALLSVVVLALGWFLGISPQLDEAAALREQAELDRERNDLLEVQVAQLKKDFENLDSYKSELAGLQELVPGGIDQASFNRELSSLSEGTGAFVVEVTSETSLPVTELFGGMAVEGVTAPSAPAGLYAVPMTIIILGDPLETLAYISAVQTETSRLFLVSDVALAGQKEAGASSGRPATAEGDAEITITGYTFVLDTDAAAAASAAASAASPAAPTTTS
ncbi:hypothetical protein [Sanguibacter suaedae]|uniref:Pilus assembly protein PilO n=1 Tax=Sanguibacter suaedae TaxID=2795737 RepID=A0A934ICD0_9MICO|nr:hypothetical protein [Sanguibacter suaedae]MBI9115358.1 hypothetical protein [Sanguibacter suaedae]